MHTGILRKWLKAGYFEKQRFFPSHRGTPQGSVISPTLANMVLDGMEEAIDKNLEIGRAREGDNNYNPYRVHLIRYADDLIVTSSDKEILEQKVRPTIESFLAERGLRLSEEKTKISHLSSGFDFLGKNIRKYKAALIIKPGKENVKAFLAKIQATIKSYPTVKTISLIRKLNPMIRGWAMYHRMDCSKNIFYYVDHRIWQMIWRWAVRRHNEKSKQWIKNRYFKRLQGRDWTLFDYDDQRKIHTLYMAGKVKIKRHVAIKGKANPYDPVYESYFEMRTERGMREKIKGRRKLETLYKRQKGICPHCQERITDETGWHVHHVIPKFLGGKDTYDNLVLLHPVCHHQIHHRIGYKSRVDKSV